MIRQGLRMQIHHLMGLRGGDPVWVESLDKSDVMQAAGVMEIIGQSIGNAEYGMSLVGDDDRLVNFTYTKHNIRAAAIHRHAQGMTILYFPWGVGEKMYCEYGEGGCAHCGMGFFDGGVVEEMIRSRECPARLRDELAALKAKLGIIVFEVELYKRKLADAGSLEG